ncbi:MAG TPA: alpha-amylase, partial [Reyranella sp.]
FIIDFEGEPVRPVEERRRKASPLRDVAGLLRSIDYAAATTLDPKNVVANRLSPGRRQRLMTRLREGAEKSFLGAYREAVSGLPSMGGPSLLDFFLVEKAAYEVGYEAANRPNWLVVPVGGLARIANRLLAKSARSRP